MLYKAHRVNREPWRAWFGWVLITLPQNQCDKQAILKNPNKPVLQDNHQTHLALYAGRWDDYHYDCCITAVVTDVFINHDHQQSQEALSVDTGEQQPDLASLQ